jgi:hypothetical protein
MPPMGKTLRHQHTDPILTAHFCNQPTSSLQQRSFWESYSCLVDKDVQSLWRNRKVKYNLHNSWQLDLIPRQASPIAHSYSSTLWPTLISSSTAFRPRPNSHPATQRLCFTPQTGNCAPVWVQLKCNVHISASEPSWLNKWCSYPSRLSKGIYSTVLSRLTFLYIAAMLVCKVMLKLYIFLHTNGRWHAKHKHVHVL